MCNIVLCGFKNCGKTTYGKILANKLKKSFLDIDKMIEEIYMRDMLLKVYLPVAEIYKEAGEKRFREMEYDAVSLMTNWTRQKKIVVATGGGSLINAETALLLKEIGFIIYLKLSKEKIKERMFRGQLPSFIDAKEPLLSFERMYKEREEVYERWADCVVNIDDMSNEVVVANIIEKVSEFGGK